MHRSNTSDKRAIAVSIISGLILLVLASAGVGFVVAYKEVWPYSVLVDAKRVLKSLVSSGAVVAEGRRHVAPAGASREPATLHSPARGVGEGHYALLGWDNSRDAYSVFLRDATGKLVHTWAIDEMSITDKAKHRENAPHAMEILSDGSIIVSFDWLGLIARLDACGKAIWSREGYFHHAFSPAADGGIWTWYGGRKSAYGQIQDILKFDPMTGDDVLSISFNRDVVKRSPESALTFSMFPDITFVPDEAETPGIIDKHLDIFHPNDVDELLPDLAPAFPQFEAGDLLLSIRELDMVLVTSPSGEIKWQQQGPWEKQHDPDFNPDGRISIFNNGGRSPRSSIITIDPQSRVVVNAVTTVPFKSEFRGKHQKLPNGNWLITVPEEGRAIEVAQDGTLVMEFNNIVPSDPRLNDDLVNVKWMPANYFENEPSCSG